MSIDSILFWDQNLFGIPMFQVVSEIKDAQSKLKQQNQIGISDIETRIMNVSKGFLIV